MSHVTGLPLSTPRDNLSNTATTPPGTSAQGSDRVICGLPHKDLSRAISFARIVLIIGLVFIHYDKFPNVELSAFDGVDTREHQLSTWFISAILYFFFSVVPLLSMISGWLFFGFGPQDAWQAIFRRMKRRFVSLYMPMVVWNAFYAAGVFAFFLAYPHHPFLSNFEFTFPFEHVKDYVNAIFGVTHRPIAFQFWFVRDLFVTALVSPLFYLCIRYAPWLGAAVLCAGWLHHSHMLIFWRADVPFFFYLGALIRYRNFNVTIPLRVALMFIGTYIVLASLRALAPYAVDPNIHYQRLSLDIATSLMRLVGVVGCWGVIYRLAWTGFGARAAKFGGLAFFLHSAHWPLLIMIKIWLWDVSPGDGGFWMLVNYFLSIAITVAFGLGLGYTLARRTPRFFSLMNGGRLLEE